MREIYKCPNRDDGDYCFNKCREVCMDGQPIKTETAEDIIARKKAYMKQYRLEHKEQSRRNTQKWLESHREQNLLRKRKASRLQSIRNGKATVQCETIINEIKTTVYRGRQHCYYFQQGKYFEIGFAELGKIVRGEL